MLVGWLGILSFLVTRFTALLHCQLPTCADVGGEKRRWRLHCLAISKNCPLETKPKPSPEVSYFSFLLRGEYKSFKGSNLSTLGEREQACTLTGNYIKILLCWLTLQKVYHCCDCRRILWWGAWCTGGSTVVAPSSPGALCLSRDRCYRRWIRWNLHKSPGWSLPASKPRAADIELHFPSILYLPYFLFSNAGCRSKRRFHLFYCLRVLLIFNLLAPVSHFVKFEFCCFSRLRCDRLKSAFVVLLCGKQLE